MQWPVGRMERGNRTTGPQSQFFIPGWWIAPSSATMRPSTVQFRLKIILRVVNTWMSLEDADDDGAAAAAAPSITSSRTVVDEVVRELPPLDYHLFVADYFGCWILLLPVLFSMGIHPVLHGAVIYSIIDNLWRIRPAVSRMTPGTIFRVQTRLTSVTLHPPVSGNLAGEDDDDDQFETYDFPEEEVQPTGMIPATEISIKALERVKVSENNNESCTICLEAMVGGSEATAMPCSHLFHDACITTWLEKSHLCPLCRFQMPTSS